MVFGGPFVGPLIKNDLFVGGSMFFMTNPLKKRKQNMKTHQNPPEPDRCINSANTGSPWTIDPGSTKTLDFDQNRTQQTQKCPFPPKIDLLGGRKRLLGRRGVSGNIPIRFRFFCGIFAIICRICSFICRICPRIYRSCSVFAGFTTVLVVFLLQFAAFGAMKAALNAQLYKQRKTRQSVRWAVKQRL